MKQADVINNERCVANNNEESIWHNRVNPMGEMKKDTRGKVEKVRVPLLFPNALEIYNPLKLQDIEQRIRLCRYME